MSANPPKQNTNARKRWMQIHAYLSIFFFPFALLFATSGVLYLWSDLETKTGEDIILQELTPEAPTTLDDVEALLREQIKQNNWAVPTGTLSKRGNKFRWGSTTSTFIEYQASSTIKSEATLTLNKVNFYGRLLNFHTGKGSSLMDTLGTLFAILLIVSYLSGTVLAFKTKWMRTSTIIAFSLGLITLILALSFGF